MQSKRVSKPFHKYNTTHQAHFQSQATEPQEYCNKYAKIISQTIMTMNLQIAQAFSLLKNIWEFGNKKCQAAHKKKLHNWIVFKLIFLEKLSNIDRKHALESLIFLTKRKQTNQS